MSKRKPKAVEQKKTGGEQTISQINAKLGTSPVARSTFTNLRFSESSLDHFGKVDYFDALHVLIDKLEGIRAGDPKEIENILASQAITLDGMFHSLAAKAAGRVEHPQHFAESMRLAFKAQAQCRATLQTLAEIKNPRPVAFVKQANIAHGNQQVNNHAPHAHAREIETGQNELLEVEHGERVDAGTEGQAIEAHQAVEAVGEIDRAKVR